MADQSTLDKNRRPRGAVCRGFERLLELLDVGRLRAFLALSDVEADALVLIEGAETLALDRRVMDKKIRTALIGGDEPETLFGVEPLDGALSHDDFLFFFVLDTDALSLGKFRAIHETDWIDGFNFLESNSILAHVDVVV